MVLAGLRSRLEYWRYHNLCSISFTGLWAGLDVKHWLFF
jgi:hypothetical protein